MTVISDKIKNNLLEAINQGQLMKPLNRYELKLKKLSVKKLKVLDEDVN